MSLKALAEEANRASCAVRECMASDASIHLAHENFTPAVKSFVLCSRAVFVRFP